MSEKLWGAAEIGAAINRNPKQTYYLLRKGLIRSARRVGEQWVVDKDELQREFSAAGALRPPHARCRRPPLRSSIGCSHDRDRVLLRRRQAEMQRLVHHRG